MISPFTSRARPVLAVAALCLAASAQALTCTGSIPARNPDSAYQISADGQTVTDPRTGLVWQRCALGQSWDGSTCTGSASTFTWAEALAQGKTNAKAGYTDWHLPNIKELASLVEPCRVNPAINDTVFPATASYFWSGSPFALNTSYAWEVNFDDGYVNGHYRGNAFPVRLVRGGQ